MALNRLGSVVVDVNGTRMDVRFLREATSPGAAPVFDDSFTIIKGEEPPPLPQLLRGPYLQKAAPSAMTVRWRTSIAGIGRIRYGTAPGVLTNLVAELAAEENHTVRLTGLTPGTKYYYQVETTGLTLAGGPNFFFTTPPPAGSTGPVRVWVLGDAGTADLGQQSVRDAFIPIHAEKPADLWLMLGDNAYGSGRDLEYQRAVFDMYHPWLEQLPLWSCIGNHETYENPDAQGRFAWDRIFDNPAAAECGGVASGTGRYYSWDYAHIHFVCLDSMIASRAANGPMAQWLTADLQANTQQWTIAFWHHPPYTKGTHDSDYEDELIEMRTNLLPILENYGVDLVLCGHSHVYERSFLLDRHYGTSDLLLPANILNAGDGREDGDGIYVKPSQGPAAHEGAVFIVAGCSGQSGSGELNHPAHFVSLDGLGSVVLDIEDNRLEARFLRDTSAGPQPVFADWFTLLKGGPALPAAPSALNVLATGDTTALINWTDNSDNEVRFEIFLAGSGGPFALTGIFPSGTTGCILTGLTDGQEYHVKVIAANAAGSASSAVFTFTHDKNAPAHTPVERWRFLHWGTTNAGGGRDPDFDADGDDSVNLLEYALGSAPRINSSQPLFSTGRAPDGRLTVSFNRTADPALLYAVEFSATLAPGSWAAVWTSTGVNNTTGPVTVTDPQANASRRFVRLRVTMP